MISFWSIDLGEMYREIKKKIKKKNSGASMRCSIACSLYCLLYLKQCYLKVQNVETHHALLHILKDCYLPQNCKAKGVADQSGLLEG